MVEVRRRSSARFRWGGAGWEAGRWVRHRWHRGVLRRHWLVAVLLVAGAVARLLVLVTFRPALEYLQDSYDYLLNARRLQPGVVRPLGYPLFLRVISSTGRLGVVPLLQHVFGLVAAVLLYTMLLR